LLRNASRLKDEKYFAINDLNTRRLFIVRMQAVALALANKEVAKTQGGKV